MHQKVIRYMLFTFGALLAGVQVQAQQQKPSERSFVAEIKKVKEIQATKNEKVRRMQKPTDSAALQPINNNHAPASTGASGSHRANNEKNNLLPASKPSEGPMKQPTRPARRQ